MQGQSRLVCFSMQIQPGTDVTHQRLTMCRHVAMCGRIVNFSIVEWKLDLLRSQTAYMKQTQFLWYARYILMLLNQL